MNVREIMTPNPVCCLPEDSAQTVESIMCQYNIGSVPVVSDRNSEKLAGIVTDRDLCCTIVAQGLDPATTAIRPFMHDNPVSCRPDETLESCERTMQKHQIRRIPVTDERGRCIGIVAQADLALSHDPQHVHQTIAEISRTRTRHA